MWYYIADGECSRPFTNKKDSIKGLSVAVGCTVTSTGRIEKGVYTYNKEYFAVDGIDNANKYVKQSKPKAVELDDLEAVVPVVTLEEELTTLIDGVRKNNSSDLRRILGSKYAKGFSEGAWTINEAFDKILKKHGVI